MMDDVDSFSGKLAVVTGGGSGMGRELVRQLAAQGAHVAACDLNADTVRHTVKLAAGDPGANGVKVSAHTCDVSDEGQVEALRDEIAEAHGADHVDLVFSNAGIGGGGSFLKDPREAWERTFAVDWQGTYNCARVFLPLLVKSAEGVLVNTSSVNGFWASLGPGRPHTAYSTAKFAVKGFTESLIEDLRVHAPHVRAVLVMPGHVGTNIIANSFRARGLPDPEAMTDDQLNAVRASLPGIPDEMTPDEVRGLLTGMNADFRDKAPLSAAEAAAIILDGVRSGAWRILVGQDAKFLDAKIRAFPDSAYDYDTLFAD